MTAITPMKVSHESSEEEFTVFAIQYSESGDYVFLAFNHIGGFTTLLMRECMCCGFECVNVDASIHER